jgi:hypothetical protein
MAETRRSKAQTRLRRGASRGEMMPSFRRPIPQRPVDSNAPTADHAVAELQEAWSGFGGGLRNCSGGRAIGRRCPSVTPSER